MKRLLRGRKVLHVKEVVCRKCTVTCLKKALCCQREKKSPFLADLECCNQVFQFLFKNFSLDAINLLMLNASLCYVCSIQRPEWKASSRERMNLEKSAGCFLLLLFQCGLWTTAEKAFELANSHLIPPGDYKRLININAEGNCGMPGMCVI